MVGIAANSIDRCTIPKPNRCICALRDTDRVLQCQVLRCQERATRNFVIDQAEWASLRQSSARCTRPHWRRVSGTSITVSRM
jgi:hypothetical protein